MTPTSRWTACCSASISLAFAAAACGQVQDVGYTDASSDARGLANARVDADASKPTDAGTHRDQTSASDANSLGDATSGTADSAPLDATNRLPPFDDGNGRCGLPWSTGGGTFEISGVGPEGGNACRVCPTAVGTANLAIIGPAMRFAVPEGGSFVNGGVSVRADGDASAEPADARAYVKAAIVTATGGSFYTYPQTYATSSWLPATTTWNVPVRDAGATFGYEINVVSQAPGECVLLADPTLLIGR
jgi:hypothetical protein